MAIHPWLVRAANGRIRVKWRDEEDNLCDQDFDTEAEARAFGGRFLEFLPDLETAFSLMGELMKRNPQMSPEEAMKRVGIARTAR